MLISPDDAKRFHHIYPQLLRFTVEKLADSKTKARLLGELIPGRVKAEAGAEARNLLFDNPNLLQEFVRENPGDLEPRDLAMVRSWRNFRKGQFIVERALKKHAVFIGSKPSAAYGVLGLVSEIDEILGYRPLPTMVETVLLPWHAAIIHDGFIAAFAVSFGPGIRRSLKEDYARLKAKGIVTSLRSEVSKTLRQTESGGSECAP
jgi:hypothetical protein